MFSSDWDDLLVAPNHSRPETHRGTVLDKDLLLLSFEACNWLFGVEETGNDSPNSWHVPRQEQVCDTTKAKNGSRMIRYPVLPILFLGCGLMALNTLAH